MRVTGGEFGGRILLVPKSGDIRPTQDSVREALFSMISASVPGAAFLDLFAGSGAVGLDALSRGAKSVTFVELSARHLDTLKRNATALAGPDPSSRGISIIRRDAFTFISSYSSPAAFDIVFADPPYALWASHPFEGILSLLAERGIVQAGGLFIAEADSSTRAATAPGWELLRERTYGKSRLLIWQRTPQSPSTP